jgi:hypothetical protein
MKPADEIARLILNKISDYTNNEMVICKMLIQWEAEIRMDQVAKDHEMVKGVINDLK